MEVVNKKPRTLRGHLFQVLLLGILPVGLFAAALLYFHWQTQDAERARMQLETTRLLAAAVDNEIDGTIKRLTILARLFSARNADSTQLYEHARAAVAASPDWVLLLAARGDGTGLLRSDVPLGTPLPPVGERPYFRGALELHRPVVSDIFISPVSGEKVIGVAVPWIENGKVTHVVAATLNLRWLDELLRSQGLPPGGIGGIFDADMKFLARSHDGDARRGAYPAPALHADMRRSAEGIGRYPSLDNTHVYTSWTRTRHGWWIAFATPAAPIDGPFWRYIAVLGGLLMAMLGIGLAFAALKGGRITGSLSLLESHAAELGAGRVPASAPPSGVTEIDRALRALDRASEVLEGAREERDALLAAEQHGRAAAEQANRAKDEFLAMLGHELRNPVAAVSNAASILAMQSRTPAQVDFAAGVIQRQVGHLKRLIDDLLDVGRVMTGKIILDLRPLDLQSVVQHVVTTLKTAGTLDKHRLEVQTAPVWVSGDQTRMEQILTNLLVNAATYTPAGGSIGVGLAEENGEAVLRVSDSGIGIAPEDRARIFELFFQGEPSGQRAQSGLGIGLTLVKRLVELHGGSVSVESEGRGRGARFTVRMAIAAAVVRRTSEFLKLGPARTVLLVEDNADERETLRVALELHGHRVLQAGDAHSALAVLRTGHPSVAIIDIGLPGMDGYGLARELRSRHNELALVALTGYGTVADARRAKEAGFQRHLTKPIEVAELAAIISRAVS
jgi:signal transduction histidine kinase